MESDLRKMIQKKQVVIVVGAGVSMFTTPRAPTWRGLIESGVERCRALGAKDDWCGMVMAHLKMESYPDMLLSAAELVHQELNKNGGGEFARWLRETFSDLQPEKLAVIEALAGLDLPLLTTNYWSAGVRHFLEVLAN